MKITVIPFIYKRIEVTPEELASILERDGPWRVVRWYFFKLIGWKQRQIQEPPQRQ